MSLPLFTDEAIYVRWSQIAKQDAAWRFISLTDGKQPMFIWLALNSMRIVDDPLLASRLVSVFAGFGAACGIFFLTLELFKKKRTGGIINQMFGHLGESMRVGYIAALLFILFPFSLVLDRMALYDALVAFLMIWCLYLEVLLIRYIRLDVSLLLGAVMGSVVLTKTSGFFSMYLLPFSLVLFDLKGKDKRLRFVKWAVLAAVSVGIAYSLYTILRLSPFFYIVDEKNALFVYPLSEWLQRDVIELFTSNMHALVEWFAIYVTVPVVVLAILSFAFPTSRREKFLLFIWFIVPFVALGTFGKTLYPRFIYFMTFPVLILAASTLNSLMDKFKNNAVKALILIAAVSFMVYADYFIIFDFARAPIPHADLDQYSNSWPAGGGVKEMVSFFDQQSKKGKIYVATQGTFGSLPTNSMEIYLGDNKNIATRGIYPLPDLIPQDLKDKAETMPVYYVFNDSENPPSNWPLTLIGKYRKGIGDRHLSIYQINP